MAPRLAVPVGYQIPATPLVQLARAHARRAVAWEGTNPSRPEAHSLPDNSRSHLTRHHGARESVPKTVPLISTVTTPPDRCLRFQRSEGHRALVLVSDLAVGGSSPSERATHTRLVGNPGEAGCRMVPGAAKRSSCVYPSRGRFDPFWGRIPAPNPALLPTLEKPLNALYFKEVDGP